MHLFLDLLAIAIGLFSILWQYRVWKPETIILVRHGESQGNVDWHAHETIPDHKIALTAKGRAQAAAAGVQFLSILRGRKIGLYCSPFMRTRQTAQGILGVIPASQVAFVKEDLRLREQEWGHLRPYEEALRIDAERDAYGALYYRVPHGESGCDTFDRASGVLHTVYRDWRKMSFPKAAGFVIHGMTLRMVLVRFFHFSPEEFETMRNPHNCEIFTMTLKPRHAGDRIMAALGIARNGKYVLDAPYPQKDARVERALPPS